MQNWSDLNENDKNSSLKKYSIFKISLYLKKIFKAYTISNTKHLKYFYLPILDENY